jgi:hypothetical protein
MLKLVPRLGASEDLDRWKKQIDKALRTGGDLMDFYDVADRMDKGYLWLFENDNAFIIVEPQTWPKGKVLHALVAGGNIEGIRSLIPIIEEAARLAGAIKLTTICRRGFADMIASTGWKFTHYYVEKEL